MNLTMGFIGVVGLPITSDSVSLRITIMTDDDVRDLIRNHATKAGSVRALAKEWGMSQAYLDKQIRGVKAVEGKTLRRLRLIRRKVYQFYPEGEHKRVRSRFRISVPGPFPPLNESSTRGCRGWHLPAAMV